MISDQRQTMTDYHTWSEDVTELLTGDWNADAAVMQFSRSTHSVPSDTEMQYQLDIATSPCNVLVINDTNTMI